MTSGEKVAAQAVPLKRRVRCCWPGHVRHNQRGLMVGPTKRGGVLVRWEDGAESELAMHEWMVVR